jgi:hypothetical protein
MGGSASNQLKRQSMDATRIDMKNNQKKTAIDCIPAAAAENARQLLQLPQSTTARFIPYSIHAPFCFLVPFLLD